MPSFYHFHVFCKISHNFWSTKKGLKGSQAKTLIGKGSSSGKVSKSCDSSSGTPFSVIYMHCFSVRGVPFRSIGVVQKAGQLLLLCMEVLMQY